MSSAHYQKDEKVLCFHHELIYDAKITGVRPIDPSDKKSGWEYKVHYLGWKNTWDDWVADDRLRKRNKANITWAKELKKQVTEEHDAKAGKLPAVKDLKRKAEEDSTRGSEDRGFAAKKRARDLETEREEQYNSTPAVRIVIPDTLKSILVDDWENVTKNLHLARIPSRTPVNHILDVYQAQEMPLRPQTTASLDLLEDVMAGLKEYFNRSLGRLLLYKYERGQFKDIQARIEDPGDDLHERQLADIYGAEHFIRLLVSMPELLAQTNMDRQSIACLREEIYKLTAWQSKMGNIQKYLSAPYEEPPADYAERFQRYHQMRGNGTRNLGNAGGMDGTTTTTRTRQVRLKNTGGFAGGRNKVASASGIDTVPNAANAGMDADDELSSPSMGQSLEPETLADELNSKRRRSTRFNG